MAHATLVDHRDIHSVLGAILGPHRVVSALHWCHCSSRDFGESAKLKADQLTLDTLGMDSH